MTTKSPTGSVSGRASASIPSAAKSNPKDFTALPRRLRRCAKATPTTWRSTRMSRAGVDGARGVKRTKVEDTLGGGVNASAGTSNKGTTSQWCCAITDRRPQSRPPGAAANRVATSACSMKCRSVIGAPAAPASKKRSKSGVEMLYGRLPNTRVGTRPSSAT